MRRSPGEEQTKHITEVVTNHLFELDARSDLRHALHAFPDAELLDVQFQRSADGLVAIATVRTPRPLDHEKVAALRAKLAEPAALKLQLVVRSVISHEAIP